MLKPPINPLRHLLFNQISCAGLVEVATEILRRREGLSPSEQASGAQVFCLFFVRIWSALPISCEILSAHDATDGSLTLLSSPAYPTVSFQPVPPIQERTGGCVLSQRWLCSDLNGLKRCRRKLMRVKWTSLCTALVKTRTTMRTSLRTRSWLSVAALVCAPILSNGST